MREMTTAKLSMGLTPHPALRATFSRKGRREGGARPSHDFPLPLRERVRQGVRGEPHTHGEFGEH